MIELRGPTTKKARQTWRESDLPYVLSADPHRLMESNFRAVYRITR
jgi:hypothetical protein